MGVYLNMKVAGIAEKCKSCACNDSSPFTAHKNTKDNSILLSPKLKTNIYSRRFYILRFNEDKLVRRNYFFAIKM